MQEHSHTHTQRWCLSVSVRPVSDLCELCQQCSSGDCDSLAARTLLSDRGNLWMRGVRMSPNYTNKGLFLHSSPRKGKGSGRSGTFSHVMASTMNCRISVAQFPKHVTVCVSLAL